MVSYSAMNTNVTIWEKPNIYPSPVYQVLSVNWSAFLKGILLTLHSHGWNNGTHGGCQLGSGDLSLLPLTLWPTCVSLANVWVSWLFMGCPIAKRGFLPHLTPPTPLHPIPPHPSLALLMAERDGKNTMNSAIRDRED